MPEPTSSEGQRARGEAALRKSEALLAAQQQAFEVALDGGSLAEALGVLCDTAVEHAGEGGQCGFYLADHEAGQLWHVVGLSDEFRRCADGVPIGAHEPGCGLAVHTGRPVLTPDALASERWTRWRWLAERFGFRGAWSFPLTATGGQVVGCLAMYFRDVREATPRDHAFVAVITRAAAIIISRHQQRQQRERAQACLRASETMYRALFTEMDEAYAVVEVMGSAAGGWTDFRFLEVNPAFMRHTGMPYPVGRTATELLGTPNPRWAELYGRAAHTGESIRVEEGELTLGRVFSLNIFRLGGEGSRRVAVLFSDITERKRAEAALAASAARQAFLVRLGDTLRPLDDAGAIQAAAARVLGEHLGATRVMYAEVEGEVGAEVGTIRGRYLADGSAASRPLAPFPDRYAYSAFGERVMALRRRGRTMVVADVTTDPAFDAAERAAWAAGGVRAAITVALVKGGRFVADFGVQSAVPRAWTADEVALVEETAERTWGAVEMVRVQRRSEEANALLVRFADAARGLTDARAIAQVACGLVADALGTERAYWAEVDWTTREYVIEAAFHRPGVAVIAGRFALHAWEPFTALHLAGRPVVVGDTQADPRVAPELRAAYRQLAVGADLATPVATGGRLRCVLVVNQRLPRHWTPEDVALAHRVADRCWAEVERARAEAALRASEERQRFLLALGDAMRAQSGTDGLIATAARLLGERLAASRILFAQFDDARGVAEVFHGWFADGAEPVPTVMRLEDYEGPILQDLRAGRTVRIDDAGDPALARPDLAAIAAVGVTALLSVPLVVGGRLLVNLSVHQHAARRWTDDEAALVQDVTARLWADLVRARAEAALREADRRKDALIATQQVLVAELQHRTRNLLGVVGSIAADLARAAPTAEVFAAQLFARLAALSRVQGLLSRAETEPVTLGELVRLELEALGSRRWAHRIEVAGPVVELPRRAVQTLALALHELATNARKHGALAGEAGRIAVRWALDASDPDLRRLALEWRESGLRRAAPVGPPAHRGYGLELIECALPYELDAQTRVEFTPDGLVCTIGLPLLDAAR